MGKRTKALSPLQKAFNASGMSLAEFAKKVADKAGEKKPPTTSTAHGWLHGTHGIKPKWLKPIAETLSLDVGELLA